jgi:hypothetical protein
MSDMALLQQSPEHRVIRKRRTRKVYLLLSKPDVLTLGFLRSSIGRTTRTHEADREI